MTEERRVLITGATGRLGKALVREFGARGWKTFGGHRGKAPTVEEGAPDVWVPLDLSKDEPLIAAAEVLTEGSVSRIAVVGNASNREVLDQDVTTLDRQSFVDLYDVDVVGHFLLVRETASRLGEGVGASAVFLSSIYGLGGVHPALYPAGVAPTPLHYSVAKAALIGLTRDLAGRLGERMRVNCVAAGGLSADQDPEFVSRYSALTQLGRMGEFNEIATIVEVLSSERSSYVTGQVISVDGGWTAW